MPPLLSGSTESQWLAAAFAAAMGVARLHHADRAGLVDVSMLANAFYASNMFNDAAAQLAGETHRTRVMRRRLYPSTEPTSDGWVGFNIASRQNLEDFLVLIEHPELLAQEDLTGARGRYARRAEFEPMVREWTTARTVTEAVAAANAFRIPAAPVHDGRTILQDPHMLAREFFVPSTDGEFVEPAPPFLFDGQRPAGTRKVAEPVGAEPITVRDRPRPVATVGPLPLAGLRVVDLGTWWAGALTSQILAALGADVIKVESTRRIDGARTLMGSLRPVRPERWWETSQMYLSVNQNKRGVTLDLTTGPGRELVVELIRRADVLVENFAPHVMRKVDLQWDQVHAINPRLVMVRQPAFGLTGPMSEHVGFAQTVEQYSGLCAATGYTGGPPLNPGGPPDPMGGANGAFAALSALYQARRTGRGVLVEAPLVESAVIMAGDQAMQWSAYGRLPERDGNHSPVAAPQGAYPVRGSDRWVAMSVLDDRQWRDFAAAAGVAKWIEDADLATAAGRRAERYRLDDEIAEWSRGLELDEALDLLVRLGIPAAAAQDPRFVREHPQIIATGIVEPVEHPVAGRLELATLPVRLAGVDRWTRTRAPLIGQHNREVLVGELGVDEADLPALTEAGVIGTVPAGH